MELVTHQRAAGFEVVVAYLKGKGYYVPKMREIGVAVHFLDLKFYGHLAPVKAIRNLVKEGHFDLVHAHLPPAELYVRLALLGIGAQQLPLLITKHNDCAFHEQPGERMLGKWVAKRAWKVVAISDAVRRFMIEPTLGLPEEQVETIVYGSNSKPYESAAPEAVAALRAQWKLPTENSMVIGFAGRLVPQKDIKVLLRAFGLFSAAHPRGARLVMLGMGPLEAELKQFAAELGLGDSVIWAGFREDVPVVMNAFDVFALTSKHEGFGLVLVEAMAAGKPVVATRAGAIPEVVVDGETGYLAEIGDSTAISESFARMLDPELRKRFGEAGRQRATERFSLDRMFAETDALYERCLRHYAKVPKTAATQIANPSAAPSASIH
jgi:glycosyltransferase involved in cell wall biosynthesis